MWKRILIPLLLLGGVAVALGFFWPFGEARHLLRYPAIVEIQEVRLGSKVGGRVEKVEVLEGQVVDANTPLVIFEMPELRAQRLQAVSRLQAAEADLEKAKNGPRKEELAAAREALVAGQAHAKMLRDGWREEEKREAKSQLEASEADLKLARDEFEREARIVGQNASSRTAYDAARASLIRSQGLYNRAKARLDMYMAGTRPEEIQQAEADARRLDANYQLLVAGTRPEDKATAAAHVEEARGKLAELDATIAESIVRAPERVLVEVVAVRKGDIVPPNQPILRVHRTDEMWVKAYIPETDLWRLQVGQAVEVTIDGTRQRFAGSIYYIAAESEFTPRNVQSPDERKHQVFGVKVRIKDPQGFFKSGMAATVLLPETPSNGN